MWSQSKFEKHRRKLAPNSIYAVVSSYTSDISLYSWNLTLVCPTKPNSSLPLDKIKLKWSFRCSNRWDWMSSWPLEQGTFRCMVWIESHKKRHTRFSNILKEFQGIIRTINCTREIYSFGDSPFFQYGRTFQELKFQYYEATPWPFLGKLFTSIN